MIKKIPIYYRIAIGTSVFFHTILLVTLIFNSPSPINDRIDNLNGSFTVIQAAAINQTTIDNQTKQVKREKEQKYAALEAQTFQEQQEKLTIKKQKITEQNFLSILRIHSKTQKLQLNHELEKKKLERRKELTLKKQHEIKQYQLVGKQQQLQKKLLQQEIWQKQTQILKTHAAEINGILTQYKVQIIQAIQKQWVVPASVNKSLSCVFLIRLSPSGTILKVKTLQSSGDLVLDYSARVAIFKASPLPVPKDSIIFSKFRELRLTIRPLQIKRLNYHPSQK